MAGASCPGATIVLAVRPYSAFAKLASGSPRDARCCWTWSFSASSSGSTEIPSDAAISGETRDGQLSQASRTVEPGISHRPRHVEQQGLGDFEIDDVAGLTSGCQQASGGKAVFLYPLSFAGEGEPASQDFGNEVLVVEPQRIEGLVRRCGHFCVALRGADNRCGYLRGVRTLSARFAVLRLVRRQPVPASAGSSLPSAESRSFPSLIARRTSLSLHPSSRANSRMLTVSKGADILGADPFGDL